MPSRDNLDLRNKNFLDFLVDYRRLLVSLVIVVTVVLTALVPRMQTDPSLKTGIDATSPAYQQYEKFVETFGEEEFILVVIKPPASWCVWRLVSSTTPSLPNSLPRKHSRQSPNRSHRVPSIVSWALLSSERPLLNTAYKP